MLDEQIEEENKVDFLYLVNLGLSLIMNMLFILHSGEILFIEIKTSANERWLLTVTVIEKKWNSVSMCFTQRFIATSFLPCLFS